MSSRAVLELRFAPLPLGERDLTGTDLSVQLVLDTIDLLGVRPRLGPQVATVGRVPTELEADQVVFLVTGRAESLPRPKENPANAGFSLLDD
jgi:hypothetical protein